MSTLLYPFFDSIIFSLYQDSIIKYCDSTEVIIFKDNPLETNTKYIEKLLDLKVKINFIGSKEYTSFIQGLDLSKYIVLPTHIDKYQHLFGFDNFDKEEIYLRLGLYNICTPMIYENTSLKFPLIAKPKNGSGSNGVIKIDTLEEYKTFIKTRPCYFLDFGKGYQYEEFIKGDTITISFTKSNNAPKLLGAYDITYEPHSKFKFATSRRYPSQHIKYIDEQLEKFLQVVNNNLKNGELLSFDVIKSENDIYVVDVMNRLPLTELSKYIYKSFANNHVEYLLGNIRDPTSSTDIAIETSQIVQKYFEFENCEIEEYNSPNLDSILEFEPPKPIIKTIWNSKIKNNCGFVIIKSNTPFNDFENILKIMNIQYKELPCIK